MKRIKAACICQTLHFFQHDATSKALQEKYADEELARYKRSLEHSKTQYRILEEKRQDDGSLIIKIIKQYNTSPVGDYLN